VTEKKKPKTTYRAEAGEKEGQFRVYIRSVISGSKKEPGAMRRTEPWTATSARRKGPGNPLKVS